MAWASILSISMRAMGKMVEVCPCLCISLNLWWFLLLFLSFYFFSFDPTYIGLNGIIVLSNNIFICLFTYLFIYSVTYLITYLFIFHLFYFCLSWVRISTYTIVFNLILYFAEKLIDSSNPYIRWWIDRKKMGRIFISEFRWVL